MDLSALPLQLDAATADAWKALLLGDNTPQELRHDLVRALLPEDVDSKSDAWVREEKRLESPLSKLIGGNGEQIRNWLTSNHSSRRKDREALLHARDLSVPQLHAWLEARLSPRSPHRTVKPADLQQLPLVGSSPLLLADANEPTEAIVEALRHLGQALRNPTDWARKVPSQTVRPDQLRGQLRDLREHVPEDASIAVHAKGDPLARALFEAQLEVTTLRGIVCVDAVPEGTTGHLVIEVEVTSPTPQDVADWLERLPAASGDRDARTRAAAAVRAASRTAWAHVLTTSTTESFLRLCEDLGLGRLEHLEPRAVRERAALEPLADLGEGAIRAARAMRPLIGTWWARAGGPAGVLPHSEHGALVRRRDDATEQDPLALRDRLVDAVHALDSDDADLRAGVADELRVLASADPIEDLRLHGLATDHDAHPRGLRWTTAMRAFARTVLPLELTPDEAPGVAAHGEGLDVVEEAVALADEDALAAWLEMAASTLHPPQPELVLAVLEGCALREGTLPAPAVQAAWATAVWMVVVGWSEPLPPAPAWEPHDARPLQHVSHRLAAVLPSLDATDPIGHLRGLMPPGVRAACDHWQAFAPGSMPAPRPVQERRPTLEALEIEPKEPLPLRLILARLCVVAPAQIPLDVHRDHGRVFTRYEIPDVLMSHARSGSRAARRLVLGVLDDGWYEEELPHLPLGRDLPSWALKGRLRPPTVHEQLVWAAEDIELPASTVDEIVSGALHELGADDAQADRMHRIGRVLRTHAEALVVDVLREVGFATDRNWDRHVLQSPKPQGSVLRRALETRHRWVRSAAALSVHQLVALASAAGRDDVLWAWADPPPELVADRARERRTWRPLGPDEDEVPALTSLARLRHAARLALFERASDDPRLEDPPTRWTIASEDLRAARIHARFVQWLHHQGTWRVPAGAHPLPEVEEARLQRVLDHMVQRHTYGEPNAHHLAFVLPRDRAGLSDDTIRHLVATNLLGQHPHPAVLLLPWLDEVWVRLRIGDEGLDVLLPEQEPEDVDGRWQEPEDLARARERARLLARHPATVTAHLARLGGDPGFGDPDERIAYSLSDDPELANAVWPSLSRACQDRLLTRLPDGPLDRVWWHRAQDRLDLEARLSFANEHGSPPERRHAAEAWIEAAESAWERCRRRLFAAPTLDRAAGRDLAEAMSHTSPQEAALHEGRIHIVSSFLHHRTTGWLDAVEQSVVAEWLLSLMEALPEEHWDAETRVWPKGRQLLSAVANLLVDHLDDLDRPDLVARLRALRDRLPEDQRRLAIHRVDRWRPAPDEVTQALRGWRDVMDGEEGAHHRAWVDLHRPESFVRVAQAVAADVHNQPQRLARWTVLKAVLTLAHRAPDQASRQLLQDTVLKAFSALPREHRARALPMILGHTDGGARVEDARFRVRVLRDFGDDIHTPSADSDA